MGKKRCWTVIVSAAGRLNKSPKTAGQLASKRALLCIFTGHEGDWLLL